MFEQILVPLDGSALGERALPMAAEIAKASNGRLILLRVVPYFTVLAADPLLYEEMNRMGEDEALAYLRSVQETLDPQLPVDLEIEVGSAADSILQKAHEHNADLIVMSSHGRSGLNRWVYGSVAERILSQAPCPTLIINARQQSWQPVPKRILVPLDGSELAEKALDPVRDLATALGSEVHLLRVTTSGHLRLETDSMAEVFTDIEGKEVEDANTYLQEAAGKLGLADTVMAVAVASASIAEAIIDYAAENDIELIVMSSHGRTGLRRWVYGSVAEKVLRSSCCASMIVREKEA
jgi:nucleotide-binding universal stress UspA family protein